MLNKIIKILLVLLVAGWSTVYGQTTPGKPTVVGYSTNSCIVTFEDGVNDSSLFDYALRDSSNTFWIDTDGSNSVALITQSEIDWQSTVIIGDGYGGNEGINFYLFSYKRANDSLSAPSVVTLAYTKPLHPTIVIDTTGVLRPYGKINFTDTNTDGCSLTVNLAWNMFYMDGADGISTTEVQDLLSTFDSDTLLLPNDFRLDFVIKVFGLGGTFGSSQSAEANVSSTIGSTAGAGAGTASALSDSIVTAKATIPDTFHQYVPKDKKTILPSRFVR